MQRSMGRGSLEVYSFNGVPGTDWFQRSQKANSKVFSKINKAAIMANIDRC